MNACTTKTYCSLLWSFKRSFQCIWFVTNAQLGQQPTIELTKSYVNSVVEF